MVAAPQGDASEFADRLPVRLFAGQHLGDLIFSKDRKAGAWSRFLLREPPARWSPGRYGFGIESVR